MKKKRHDHNGGKGIVARASGYTTKVNPGPATTHIVNAVSN